jgi:hypothetical protein
VIVFAQCPAVCLPLGDGELVADGLIVVPRPQQIPPLPYQLLFELCNLHASRYVGDMALCAPSLQGPAHHISCHPLLMILTLSLAA